MLNDDTDYNYRYRSGIKWQAVTNHGRMVISGFTVDNLNTKTLDQAVSPFEEMFIRIREVLEQNSACCLDNEKERLDICQAISDELRKASRQSKKKCLQ